MRSPAKKTAELLSQYLPKLKAKTLTSLSLAAGLPTTGTKTTLVDSLSRNLPAPRLPSDGPIRILSVDMGIRNLAFACLDVQRKAFTREVGHGAVGKSRSALVARGKRKGDDADTHAQDLIDALRIEQDGVIEHVKLVEWDRIGISDVPVAAASDGQMATEGAALPSPPQAPSKRNRKTAPSKSEELTEAKAIVTPAEVFTPAALAPHAHKIVTAVFLRLNPTHILIERQRHRSGGGAAVLEWTFRVNMLESMLYAVLATMRAERFWRAPASVADFPDVLAMDPKRVSGYWTAMAGERDEEGGKGSEDLKKEKHRKALRIGLVERWLTSGRLACDQQALLTENQFLNPRTKGRKGKRTAKIAFADDHDQEEEMDVGQAGRGKAIKRDDLADALAQGVAFAQWEANRRAACERLTQQATTRKG